MSPKLRALRQNCIGHAQGVPVRGNIVDAKYRGSAKTQHSCRGRRSCISFVRAFPPVVAPINRLRDVPTRRGIARDGVLESSYQSKIFIRSLAKPKPGSRTIRAGQCRHLRPLPSVGKRKSADHRPRHRVFRLHAPPGMHHDQARSGFCNDSCHRRIISKAINIVHNVSPRFYSQHRRFRSISIDGDQAAGPSGQSLNHRQNSPLLLKR